MPAKSATTLFGSFDLAVLRLSASEGERGPVRDSAATALCAAHDKPFRSATLAILHRCGWRPMELTRDILNIPVLHGSQAKAYGPKWPVVIAPRVLHAGRRWLLRTMKSSCEKRMCEGRGRTEGRR